MNRKQRRQRQATAKAAAALLAGACYDYTLEGRVIRVSHPEAIKALKRAFQMLIENDCEPQVVKLPYRVAVTFPGKVERPDLSTYLAVGVDVDGRGTYSLRQIVTPGATGAAAEMCNRAVALSCLAPKLKERGFPIKATAGTC